MALPNRHNRRGNNPPVGAGIGGGAGGAGAIANPPKPDYDKTPKIKFTGTTPATYFTKYHYEAHPEGREALERKFPTLAKAQDPSKGPVKLGYGNDSHEHPYAANGREYSHAKICYVYAPKGTKRVWNPNTWSFENVPLLSLDIGTSAVRLSNMWDEPVLENGAYTYSRVCERTYSTAPKLTVRDVMRQNIYQNNRGIGGYLYDNMPLHCGCTGGSHTNDCFNCNDPERFFDYLTSIDSGYFADVHKEMAKQAVKFNCKSVGYMAFNNYCDSIMKGVYTGETTDNESRWKVTNRLIKTKRDMSLAALGQEAYDIYMAEPNQDLEVRSEVNGNPEDYIHGIVNTGGKQCWVVEHTVPPQYAPTPALTYNPYTGRPNTTFRAMAPVVITPETKVACIYEIVDRWENKTVYYDTVRVTYVPWAEYVTLGKLDVYHTKDFLMKRSQIPRKEVVEIDPVILKDNLAYIREINAVIDSALIREPTSVHHSATAKSLIVNLSRQSEKFGENLAAWDSLCYTAANLFSEFKTNERLFTSIGKDKDGKDNLFITAELYKSFAGIHYRKAELTFKAPLMMVMKAYDALGSKQTLGALNNSIANYQKKILEKDSSLFATEVFGGNVLHCHEAFLIARIMKGQQEVRANKVFSLASSLQTVKA